MWICRREGRILGLDLPEKCHRSCLILEKECKTCIKSEEAMGQTQTEGHSTKHWHVLFKNVKVVEDQGHAHVFSSIIHCGQRVETMQASMDG